MAQCFSFLGVIFALAKDFLNKQSLFVLTCACSSVVILLMVLMLLTYKKDKDDK